MKVLVTGAKGQLGWEVVRRLQTLRVPCVGVDAEDFDLTDPEAVVAYVTAQHPDAIIHCAGYTNVERAETEPEVCCRVNGMGTLNLVRAALQIGAKLLYVSTDYVFHGEGSEPYEVDAPRRPLSIYGQSMLQGEEAVQSLMSRYFIVRSSWIFGAHAENYISVLLRTANDRREISVAGDQIGAPTYAPDLARLICDMIRTNRFGVYHAANEGEASRADVAQTVMAMSGRRARIREVATVYSRAAARRPRNSRLSMAALDQAGFARLPDWRNAILRYLDEVQL